MWGDEENALIKYDNMWMRKAERVMAACQSNEAALTVVAVPGHIWWRAPLALTFVEEGRYSSFSTQLCALAAKRAALKPCRAMRV